MPSSTAIKSREKIVEKSQLSGKDLKIYNSKLSRLTILRIAERRNVNPNIFLITNFIKLNFNKKRHLN